MSATSAVGLRRHQRSFAFRLRVALAAVVTPCVAVGVVAFVGLGQAAGDVRDIDDDASSEQAVISELQREVRHAEVEVNLLITTDEHEARDELHNINLVLEAAFARVASFDSAEEQQTGARAEQSWNAARVIEAEWLTATAGQLDTSRLDEFHKLADAATSDLFALDALNRRELAANMVDYNRRVDRYQQALVVALVAACLVTAWVARRLRLAAYRPLRQLESSLDLVGETGLSQRVEITGDREFHAVADALNEMSDRLQTTLEELERQAFHDSLTGLPNRALLERHLVSMLADPTVGPVGVVMMDLDGFKAINDGLGHPAGDEVLIAIGERLERSLRPNDMIGRLGGDEFAVVVTDMSPDGIDAISALVAEPFQQPIVAAGLSLLIGSSAGAAVARPGDTPADLFRHADIALYSAKDAGKARLHLFEPGMLDEVEQRLTTQTELRAAVEAADQILVHYQPIVRTRTGRIVGVEALARWNHPTRGLLGPATFIALAEDTGLIVPLGQIVLEMACAQVAAWQDVPELAGLSLSVNVSARQLRTAEIVDQVRAALADSGLPAASLVLEVTESITADTDAVAMLHELRDLGIRIALDDFGTGYSSLAYLEKLPIDVLKIDKSFVDDIHTQASRASLANAIIRLGRSFGLQTVAEGVEKPEQLLLLTELGCDLTQGFLIARPGPPEAIRATLVSLAGAHAAAHVSTSDDSTVTVQVGPVAAASAVAWLEHTAALLDVVRSPLSGYISIPPGVWGAIDTYMARWTELAAAADPFLWSGREDPNILRAVANYWFRLTEMRVQREVLELDPPAATEEFNEALISAILVALTVGADGEVEVEAEAIAYQRSWPATLTDQSATTPALTS
jgi:diguanylate cyclase (GGDEF)-like protein